MIGIKHTFDEVRAMAGIEKTAGRMADVGPFLQDCGLVLIRSVAQNFKTGGRPVRWEKSVRAENTGGQTLVQTARLKNSITFDVNGNTLTLGSNVKYARIHQLGGKIDKNVTVKKHWRLMTKAFGKPIAARSVLVKSHERKMNVTMPARPFLMVQEADWRIIRRIYADHVAG